MALSSLPRIDRLTLARVTRVPEWHPEHATFEPFPVHAWVVHHPDGPILVDTGIGLGNDVIDAWYGPEVTALEDALSPGAVDDITAVVLSHLHFDHCGQQRLLDAPVFVQAAEHRAVQLPHYTVPEWAVIPVERLRLVDGDEDLAEGVRIFATPGHTPGHQSVVVEGGDRRIVLAGQCAFRAGELRTGEPADSNLHDESWREAARSSLARVASFGPAAVHLSHDHDITHL